MCVLSVEGLGLTFRAEKESCITQQKQNVAFPQLKGTLFQVKCAVPSSVFIYNAKTVRQDESLNTIELHFLTFGRQNEI